MEACECERDNELEHAAGAALHQRQERSSAAWRSPAAASLSCCKQKLTDEQLIEELYFWSLARPPSAKETAIGLAHFKEYDGKRGRGGPGPDVGAAQQQGLPVQSLSRAHAASGAAREGDIMDQVFEGTPKAEIRLEGRKVIRGDVTNDWGSRLQWEVRRDGQVIATPPARAETELRARRRRPPAPTRSCCRCGSTSTTAASDHRASSSRSRTR